MPITAGSLQINEHTKLILPTTLQTNLNFEHISILLYGMLLTLLLS